MKIVWWPRYGYEKASSRLRVYAIHEALLRKGHVSLLREEAELADVLVLQKITDINHLAEARKCKGMVIYDFDDLDIAPGVEYARKELASVFTTDTSGHREDMKPYWNGKPCEVLPDPIDYFPNTPLPTTQGTAAIWFGCYLNYASAKWMGDWLKQRTEVRIFVEPGQLREEGARDWYYHGFTKEFRDAGIAFLSHDQGDRNKSNNKMITAITHGLPCIVSDTPAYSDLARRFGFNWTVVRNEQELQNAYERLSDPTERQEYLSVLQPEIWKMYSASAIADQFLDLVWRY